MATYKVIQDIEAEDKLLGPLTFRQFVYALITALLIYFCVLALMKNLDILVLIFLPPCIFTGFFAFPWRRDQPTEVWALAKIQFLFKSHKRVWDQSGVKELVTITVPKRLQQDLTNGLSENEAKSRLHALADTLDSRGWITKNVSLNAYSQPSILASQISDRLIDVDTLPQEVPNFDINPADDILDAQNNPIAQQLNQMMQASSQAHHQQLSQKLAQPATAAPTTPKEPSDYWFLNQSPQLKGVPKDDTVFSNSQLISPGTSTDDSNLGVTDTKPNPGEEALAQELKTHQRPPESAFPHMRIIQPLGSSPASSQASAQTKTDKATPAEILELANNNDLNVATLARQANQVKTKEPPEDEVVISLH
jgi:hypothetical protein